jgi:hypothetical protein
MDNDQRVSGEREFPYILKFRLPSGTIEFFGFLPEELNPDDVHICAAYDTQRWQPVKFEFRHKTGHEAYKLTFLEKLPSSVEVCILRSDDQGSDPWS